MNTAASFESAVFPGRKALEHAMDLPAGAAAYRIVQESLTNALKHAGPARIDVNLECTDENLVVTVRDNGLGHSARRRSVGGRGIAGMTERANVLGGRLTAHPLPEGGFCVTATIPRRLERHRYAVAPADRSRQ